MATTLAQIQLASQNAADWDANKILKLGQKGIETDTGLEKTGDGITTWSNLDYLKVRIQDVKTNSGFLSTDGSIGADKITVIPPTGYTSTNIQDIINELNDNIGNGNGNISEFLGEFTGTGTDSEIITAQNLTPVEGNWLVVVNNTNLQAITRTLYYYNGSTWETPTQQTVEQSIGFNNYKQQRGPLGTSVNLFPRNSGGLSGSGEGGAIEKGDTWYYTESGVIQGVSINKGASIVALKANPSDTNPADWLITDNYFYRWLLYELQSTSGMQHYRDYYTILQNNTPTSDTDYIGTSVGFSDEDDLVDYLTTSNITPTTGNVALISGIYYAYNGTKWINADDYVLTTNITTPVYGDYAQIKDKPDAKARLYFFNGVDWSLINTESGSLIRTKNIDYALQLSDANYLIMRTNGSATKTWTIPANSSVEFATDTRIELLNLASGDINLEITPTDILIKNGIGSVANLIIPQYSKCLLHKITQTKWFAEIQGLATTQAISLATITEYNSAHILELSDYAETSTKIINLNITGASNLTIPTNASVNFPVGAMLHFMQTGDQVTITPVNGTVTVNGTPGLKFRAQYSAVTLIQVATDVWLAWGDLSL